jgi:hypothetical protein
MLPNELVYEILTNYVNVTNIYIINKEFNIYFNIKINKNIKIIQKFNKYIRIPNVICDLLHNEIDNPMVNDCIIKRFWIQNYPYKYIIPNIKLAANKVPPTMNTKRRDELTKLNNEIVMGNNKNLNYFINKYVSILTVEELLFVGY